MIYIDDYWKNSKNLTTKLNFPHENLNLDIKSHFSLLNKKSIPKVFYLERIYLTTCHILNQSPVNCDGLIQNFEFRLV